MSDLQTQTVGAPPGTPPGLVGTDDNPPDRSRGPRWPAILVVVLLVIGGATYGAVRFLAPAEDHAIAFVPRDSLFYANLFLRPSTAQRRAIRDLLARSPVETPEGAEAFLADLLDPALAEFDLRFETDIAPWLGDEVGVFMLAPRSLEEDPEVGFLVATDDEEATREVLDRGRDEAGDKLESRTYQGYEYDVQPDGTVTTFLGSFVFAGTEPALRAAVDAEEQGRSLDGSRRYERATEALERDRLLLAYFNERRFFDYSLRVSGEAPFMLRGLQDVIAGGIQASVVYARSSGLVIDGHIELAPSGLIRDMARFYGDPGMIERMPSDVWAVLNLPGLGPVSEDVFADLGGLVPGFDTGALSAQIEETTGLDVRRDLFSWIGDAGLFLIGTDPDDLGGGLIVSSTDADASKAAINRIAGALIVQDVSVRQRSWPSVDGPLGGYSIDFGAPKELDMVDAGDKLIFAYDEDATRRAISDTVVLGPDPIWDEITAPLGREYVPFAYVEIQSVQFLIEAMGAEGTRTYEDSVRPWLESLSYVIAGAQREGNNVLTRTVIGVE